MLLVRELFDVIALPFIAITVTLKMNIAWFNYSALFCPHHFVLCFRQRCFRQTNLKSAAFPEPNGPKFLKNEHGLRPDLLVLQPDLFCGYNTLSSTR